MSGIVLQCVGVDRVWLVSARGHEDQAMGAFALLNAKGQSRGKNLKQLLMMKKSGCEGWTEDSYLFRMEMREPEAASTWQLTDIGRLVQLMARTPVTGDAAMPAEVGLPG